MSNTENQPAAGGPEGRTEQDAVKTLAGVPEHLVSSVTYDEKGNAIAATPMTKPRPPVRRREEPKAEAQPQREAPAAAAPTPARTFIDDVVDAIRLLDAGDRSAWTADGRPRVKAIETVLGAPVTDDQRDHAWAQITGKTA